MPVPLGQPHPGQNPTTATKPTSSIAPASAGDAPPGARTFLPRGGHSDQNGDRATRGGASRPGRRPARFWTVSRLCSFWCLCASPGMNGTGYAARRLRPAPGFRGAAPSAEPAPWMAASSRPASARPAMFPPSSPSPAPNSFRTHAHGTAQRPGCVPASGKHRPAGSGRNLCRWRCELVPCGTPLTRSP